MKMKNKSQASFEFLTNYSWILVLVLLVTGFLVYAGFLDGLNFAPERCDFLFLNCKEFAAYNNTLSIMIENTHEEPIIVRNMIAASPALSGKCELSSKDQKIKPEENQTFDLDLGHCKSIDTGQSKNYYDVNLTYSWHSTLAATDTITGTVFARTPCKWGGANA